MTAPASHLDLLAIARAVRRAVISDDTADLHCELTRLRLELVHHVHAEHDRFDELPPGAAAVAREGQHRLLRLLSEVLFRDAGAASDCNCIVRAAEIELALVRQAKLEGGLLRHHPSTFPLPRVDSSSSY